MPDDKPVNQDTTAPTGEPPVADPTKPVVDAKPAEKPAEAPAPKVPDKYDFAIKDSDGNVLEIDPETTAAFVPVLKQHGITQEALSALIPLYHAELARQDQVITELYTAQRDSWAAAAKADKEFGGANYEANVQFAQKAIARFGSPALKDLFNESGLGNHVEVLRFFANVGRQISEDTHVSGGTAATGERDMVAKLFDHPTSKHTT